MTSVSFLSSLGWIPLGHIDFCAFTCSSKSCTGSGLTGSCVYCSDGPPTLWPPEPIISVEDRQRSHQISLFYLCPFLWDNHLHQVTDQCYLWSSFYCKHILKCPFWRPPQCWPASTLIMLWPYNIFFPTMVNSISVVLPGYPTSFPVGELTPLVTLDEIWLVQLTSRNSLNGMLSCSSDSAILAIYIVPPKKVFIL